MKTTVIIPTYEERANIVPIIRAVFAAVPEARVVVVDDSSPDGTGQAVAETFATDQRVALLTRTQKDGLGRAYLFGFERVLVDQSVEAIVTMDADFSHDPASIPDLIAALAHADVAIGSRYVSGGTMEGWELWRRLLSRGGNAYTRLITQVPVWDMTGGFNAYRAAALRGVDRSSLASSGYAFQMELKHALWRAGGRITEVPIAFHARREGESKISNHIIREGLIAPWLMRFKR